MTTTVLARIGRQSWAYAFASAAGPATSLLLLPLYTRYLGPAEYGLIAVLEVIALVLSAVFSLGLPALVPFIYVEREGRARKRALGTIVAAVTAINVCLAGLVWAGAAAVLQVVLPSVPFWPYLPLVILTAVFEPYWVMAGASLQIQEKAGRYAVWATARVLVMVAVRIAFVVALAWGAVGYIAGNLATAVVFSIAAFWLLRTEIVPAFSRSVLHEAFRVGGPTVPNNLLSYGFRLLDRIVLERFVSLEQVGLYYLALKLADVLRLTGDILINAWRPVFFKEADRTSFGTEDAPRVIRIATVVLASAFVTLSAFARDIVAVFAAPAYRQAFVFVPLLSAAMFFKGFQSFPYLVIWLRKKTNWVPVLSFLTLAVSIAANVILARQWGAMGVAGALLLAYVFLTAMMLLVARRLYRLTYPWRTLIITGALSVVAVVASAMVPAHPAAVFVKILLVSVYMFALVLTGCIHPAEVRALRPVHGVPAVLRRNTVVS